MDKFSLIFIVVAVVGIAAMVGMVASGENIIGNDTSPKMAIYTPAKMAPGVTSQEAQTVCENAFGPSFSPGWLDMTDKPMTMECSNNTHAGVTTVPNEVFEGSNVILNE